MSEIISSKPSKDWKDRAAGYMKHTVKFSCGHVGTLQGTRKSAIEFDGVCDDCQWGIDTLERLHEDNPDASLNELVKIGLREIGKRDA